MRGVGVSAASIAALLAFGSASSAATASQSWTGFYVGAHAGVAAARADARYYFTGWDGLGFFNGEVGAYAGFNLQAGDTIMGVEADATWLGMHNIDYDGTVNARVHWMGAIDGRVGRLLNSETLLYAKFGPGVINFEVPAGSYFGPMGPAYSLAAIQLGVGMEANLGGRWKARVEGVYTYATEDYTTYDSATEDILHSRPEVLAARVGISYGLWADPKEPPPPVKGWDWSGFYLGANAGWAISDTREEYFAGPENGKAWDGFGASHGNVGVVAGVNWQSSSGKHVFGIEAAGTLLNLNNSDSYGLNWGTVDWSAALDARFGTLLNPATLLYAKAGGALIAMHSNYPNYPDPPTSYATLPGLQFGAGMEAQLNEHWSARVEGLYTVALRGLEFDNPPSSASQIHGFRPQIVSASLGIIYRN
jgi:outer membrane immunogenic protein